MDKIDPKAAVAANEKLWKNHPELAGRQLTMGPEDAAYRKEWMESYHEAAQEAPNPPPPKVNPQPVPESPPPKVASDTSVPCARVARMTHEEKMEEAINRANLGPEIMEELGDIKTLVATMVVVTGVLVGIAATGYGAIAEAIGAVLLIFGAAMSGVQIGQGINSMIDFYQQTRCDSAKTPENLDAAGKSFGDGIAKMGVGGLTLLLGLLGGKGKTWRGKAIKPNAPKITNKSAKDADAFVNKHAYERHKYDPSKKSTKSKTQYGEKVDPQKVADETLSNPDKVTKLYDENGNHFATRYEKSFAENISTPDTPTTESRVIVNHVDPSRSTQFPKYNKPTQ